MLKTAEEINKEKEEQEKDAPLKDSKGQILKAPVVKEDTVSKDSYGRVLKEAKKEEKPKDVKMIQDGSMMKKIQHENEEGEKFVKHQSFENYI